MNRTQHNYGADRVGMVGKPSLLPVRNVFDLTNRDRTSNGPLSVSQCTNVRHSMLRDVLYPVVGLHTTLRENGSRP